MQQPNTTMMLWQLTPMVIDNNDALEGGENTHLPAASPAAAAPVSKLFQPRSQPEIS